MGFSTSRTIAHRAIDGEPVPGTFAAEDELFGIGAALGELGTGIFELAPAGVAGEDVIAPIKEVDWMRRLSVAIGRPVTFALLQISAAPDLWRELMAESLRAADEGAQLWPQVAARATGLLTGLHTSYSLFDAIPAYQALKARNLDDDQLVQALRDPSVRDAIVSFEPDDATARGSAKAYEVTFVLGTPPDYEPGPERSLASIAAASGRHPLEVAYDVMLEANGHGLLYFPILNYASMSLEPVREMLLHPALPPDWETGEHTAGSSATRPSRRSCSRTGHATAPVASGCRSNGSSRSRPTTPPGSTGSATGAPSSRAWSPTST